MKQIDLLLHVVETLEKLHVPYMLVGSYASSLYGEVRSTLDIDLVIDLASEQVDSFCQSFPPPEYYLSEQAVHDAVRDRFQFNVLHPASGNKIDFMLSRNDDWGREQMAHRQRIGLLPNGQAYAARPEDIILGKLRYYDEGRSEKHLRDIAGILKLQEERLNREYITQWANRLGVSQWWKMAEEQMKY